MNASSNTTVRVGTTITNLPWPTLTIGYGVPQPDPRIWEIQWPEDAFVVCPRVIPRPVSASPPRSG